jgi:hypothetical protein
MRFKSYIKEGGTTGMGADGLSKQKLRTLIYKETKKCTYNKIYKDRGWKGPQCIWDVFNKLDLNWQIDKSEYKTEKNPSKSMTFQMPVSKKWDFTIHWENNKGKYGKMYGYLIASGAGSVSDPLERYDLILVVGS